MNVLAEYVDELRQRAEKSEDRLAAIDGAQTVAVIRDEDYPHIYRLIEDRFKLPPIGTELIARPTKD